MPKKPLSFCFLLFDGFSNMVLASALEPLRAARNLPFALDLSWSVASPSGAPAKSSSGLVISPDCRLEDLKSIDYLVLVSGYGVHGHATAANLARIRRARKAARAMIAVDSGSWLLAAAGLLDGQKATIHWQELNAFAEAFPEVDVSKSRFVASGPFITCGGASTVMEMILNLLKETYGPAVAFDVSNLFVYDVERDYRMERGPVALKSRGSQKLRAAAQAMFESLERPLSLQEIAAKASTSLRSLNRIFLNELETSPGKYYQMLRLTRARDLASETDLSLKQIAYRTGFSSSATLSRAFSEHYGWPISDTRKHRKGGG
jgi:transcriptional regulator GlxA family with amidase domain